MDFIAKLEAVLAQHSNVLTNPARNDLIDMAIKNRESVVSANGALTTWTPAESSGRSPKDTLIVDRDGIRDTIDWDAPNNLPVDPETFEMLWEDAMAVLAGKETILITEKVVGAESSYALPVRTITDRANIAIFAENMFRPIPDDIDTSIYADKPFLKIDYLRYGVNTVDIGHPESFFSNRVSAFFPRTLWS